MSVQTLPLTQDAVTQTSAPMQSEFQALSRDRRRFVLRAVLFLLIFNLAQPIVSVSTTWLDGAAFGGLTWGWIYAFAQFPVPLVILHLYLRKARKLECVARAIKDRQHG